MQLRVRGLLNSARSLPGLAGGFFFLALIAIGAPEGEADKSADSAQKSVALEALSRLKGMDLEANPALKNAVLKILDKVRGTPAFLEIVRDFKIKGEAKEVLNLAIKYPEHPAAPEAMRVVLSEQDTALLQGFLATSNAPKLIKVLANTGDKQIVSLLLPVIQNNALDIATRKVVVQGVARVENGASALLDLAQEQKLPADLKMTATSALHSAPWPAVKSRAAELLPLPQGKNATPLPSISELVKLRGDAVKGEQVFKSEPVGCNKCHQVNGQGTDFGPNLSEIGAKLGKDALYESVLDPSAGISFGYESWEITLKNGDEAVGLIVSETQDELAVKVAGGIVMRYRKGEIAKRQKQKLSIMPAGLQQAMTPQELVDLIEYLTTLKGARH